MRNLKVLIADDSVVYRRIISSAVLKAYPCALMTMVENGIKVLEELQKQRYDVVLLDVNMPEMDGITALMEIKKKFYELPVIMISAAGMQGAELTMQALEKGALDFIVKPINENFEKNLEFVSNYLKSLFDQIISVNKAPQNIEEQVIQMNPVKKTENFDIVVIASSTGGPKALEKIFFNLDKSFSKPILVVQHMPPDFTRILADTLNRKSAVDIKEGNMDDIVRAGQAFIAPGGYHMIVKRGNGAKRIIELLQTPLVCGVRPAANVLLQSVAEAYRGLNVLAIILTGMGNDGLEGIKELKKNTNCYCITQSEASCTIYGMPRCVYEAGLSDEVIDIDNIAARIQQITERGI